MEIEITITHNGEKVVKADALDFESAQEELGKLERYCKTHSFCRKCGEQVESDEGIEDNALCGQCAK